MSGSGSWEDPYDPCHPSSNDSDEEGPQFGFHGIHHERYESPKYATHDKADVDSRDHHARRQGYGPEQRDSQESLVNGDTHDDSGQASYSYNPRLAMPTFGNDSGDGAQHDLTTYNGQHQYSMLQPIEDPTAYTPTPGYELHGYYTQKSQQQNSPAIEPSVDFHMAVDFDIDFNVGFDPGPLGMEFDAVPVSGDQVEYREEAPWSSENHYNEYSRPPVEQLTSWANLVGASQTSSASHHSSDTENLVSSSADSSGDAEDPDWGESSVATMRPTHPLPSNPSDHSRGKASLYHLQATQSEFNAHTLSQIGLESMALLVGSKSSCAIGAVDKC
ncbi:uncharacterized protein J4E79_005134 [Alternaria viburni]|uniref:uncharacterized protein n=1 Tax=Alternaria viburni TaxID=566460 RepID=UPI0020C40917|nr:uncharacterized protein J4E79_005134 [Alternaria viburni]KAI4661321.1 hypothetical protein J4E79_005134 [Alternaria viburni]